MKSFDSTTVPRLSHTVSSRLYGSVLASFEEVLMGEMCMNRVALTDVVIKQCKRGCSLQPPPASERSSRFPSEHLRVTRNLADRDPIINTTRLKNAHAPMPMPATVSLDHSRHAFPNSGQAA